MHRIFNAPTTSLIVLSFVDSNLFDKHLSRCGDQITSSLRPIHSTTDPYCRQRKALHYFLTEQIVKGLPPQNNTARQQQVIVAVCHVCGYKIWSESLIQELTKEEVFVWTLMVV